MTTPNNIPELPYVSHNTNEPYQHITCATCNKPIPKGEKYIIISKKDSVKVYCHGHGSLELYYLQAEIDKAINA